MTMGSVCWVEGKEGDWVAASLDKELTMGIQPRFQNEATWTCHSSIATPALLDTPSRI